VRGKRSTETGEKDGVWEEKGGRTEEAEKEREETRQRQNSCCSFPPKTTAGSGYSCHSCQGSASIKDLMVG
jgi:hypothetical protein